jgi:hypothetical protein
MFFTYHECAAKTTSAQPRTFPSVQSSAPSAYFELVTFHTAEVGGNEGPLAIRDV